MTRTHTPVGQPPLRTQAIAPPLAAVSPAAINGPHSDREARIDRMISTRGSSMQLNFGHAHVGSVQVHYHVGAGANGGASAVVNDNEQH